MEVYHTVITTLNTPMGIFILAGLILTWARQSRRNAAIFLVALLLSNLLERL